MKNVISHLSQIDMLVIIAKSVSVSNLLNLSLALLAKSSRSMVKNLTTHCVTHGLNHCLDTSSSILKILDKNKFFFLRLFREKKLEGKFDLSFTTKVMNYLSLKKNKTKKSAKAINKWEKNSKGKSEEVEEICNSN